MVAIYLAMAHLQVSFSLSLSLRKNKHKCCRWMSSFSGESKNKSLTAWAGSALTGRRFLRFKDNEHEWPIHTTKYNFRNDPCVLLHSWDWGELLKKIILWLKLSTAVKETNRKQHLQAVNSLCGPRGAYVHTRSYSQTGETCTNKSKLIVMHFPSAKKFNYDGCDRAIQGSRLHYWLVP